ncbi:hypothetical protein BH09MYX1_BH09MYX1_63960 [soil metagenome]
MTDHGPWNPHPARTADDDDVDALSQLGMARGAGGAMIAAGVSAVLSSFQTWLMVGFRDVLVVVPWVILFAGAFAVYLGIKLVGARRWAAVTTVAFASILFVVTGAWTALDFLYFHFTAFFLLLTPMACLTALVLAFVAIPTCDRAERARARLAKEGIDLGV